MAKNQNAYYFDNFVACAEQSCQAAKLLEEILQNFDVEKLAADLDRMHAIEHAADVKKHDMLNVLVKAFITPIDREDIIQVSQNVDELTDKIEEVLIRIYVTRVKTIRPDALQFVQVIGRCCDEVLALLKEFGDFKHSKTMKEHIIAINSLEEQADKLYMDSMYQLHGSCTDPLEVIAWRDVYTYLEKCADTCEHIADIVESVAMKNS